MGKLAAMKSGQNEEEKSERRIENERRQFSYSAYIPERRSGQKRRKEADPSKASDDPNPEDRDD